MTLTITIHQKWLPYFWNHLKPILTVIHLIVMLGIPLLYSVSFAPYPASFQWSGHREQRATVDPDVELVPVCSIPDGTINVDVAITEAFKVKIDIIVGHWQMIQYGSGVLIAAALTLPQLQASRPDTQSFGLASFFSALCGLAALLFTFIYLPNKDLLMNPTTIVQWPEASALPCIKYSSLWDILSVPAVWFSWCCISFIISILQQIWYIPASTSNPLPDSSNGSTTVAIEINVLGAVLSFVMMCMIFRHIFITFKGFSKMS